MLQGRRRLPAIIATQPMSAARNHGASIDVDIRRIAIALRISKLYAEHTAEQAIARRVIRTS
jgi:hypothetical protein